MTRPGPAKIILSLIALFFLGGVCGYVFADHQPAPPPTKGQWEEQWMEMRMHEDMERLKLTPEQVALVRPTYDQLVADLRRLREQTARGLFRAVSAQGRTLAEQLTPEQREEYQKLTQERRARFPRR